MTTESDRPVDQGEKTDGTECFACGVDVDIQKDEWWSHSWEERPSEENIEKALDDPDFRDWFVENYVFCEGCHKDLIHKINGIREDRGVKA